MRKLFAFATLLVASLTTCHVVHADPYDLRLVQSNSIDNGPVNLKVKWPTQDALFYFNPVTLLPATVTLGGGLTISNGVLAASATSTVAQVNSDWTAATGVQQILNKPLLKLVATSGLASDLTGLATVALSGSYADLTAKPALFSGVYADLTGKPIYATVASTGSYTDLINRPTIPASPAARVFTTRTPALNTCFQLSTTRDVQVSYAVDITATLTVSGQSRGSAYLRTYTDSACTLGQQALVSGTGGLPSALSVAVGLQNLGSAALSAVVPAGAWVRIETSADAGTPTFAARQGQEVQL